MISRGAVRDFFSINRNGKNGRTTKKVYNTLQVHFDKDYYLSMNNDIAAGVDLLEHYLTTGWKEGRNPNAWFSTIGYLDANPDVKSAGVNPFYHYIAHGRAERRSLFRTFYGLSVAGNLGIDESVGSVYQSARVSAARTKKAAADARIYSPELMKTFSVSDYRFASGMQLDSVDDYFVDFVTRGYKDLLPISFDQEFDPLFYREYDASTSDLSPVEAYMRWLAEGLRNRYPPNKSQFLRMLRITQGYLEDSFDDEMYRCNNKDLPKQLNSSWLRLEHFVQQGAGERRPGCPVTEKTACLYVAAADNQVVKGREREGRAIYEEVLIHIPNHLRALNHFADSLLRQEQFGAAAAIYRRRIASGPASIFAYLNLSTCLFRLGALDESVDALDAGIAKFPEDNGLRMRRRELLARSFEKKAQLASTYAMASHRAETGAIVDAAAAKLRAAWEPTTFAARRKDKIEKVAILGDHALPQCRLYRIDQKLDQFATAGIDAEAFKFIQDVDALGGRMHEFDAIIFYRVPGWNETLQLISTARQLGIPTFYEIDDLIFDIEHYPEDYEGYGGLITKEEYASLMAGAPVFRGAMQACDYGIASTAPLAKHMEKNVRSGKVFVHRNALGLAHLEAIAAEKERKPGRKLTLFYGSGTKAHKRDFEDMLAPALAKIFAKYGGRIRLRLAGFQEIPPTLSSFEQYIESNPPIWDVAQYWKLLAKSDINLAVLSRSEATDSKSEIKWMEAGMFGIPSVVSRLPNYEDTVEHGVTGLLAETPDEWFVALDRLIASQELRKQIGAAARKAVGARYSESVMARNLSRIMEEVTPARSPGASRRKRILVANVFYPPQAIGGATRVARDNVCDLLERHGQSFDVEVFATLLGDSQAYRVRSYAHEGVRVTTVSTPSEADLDTKALDPKMEAVFSRFLASCQPDLVHFHCMQRLTASLAGAARRFGIPYVVTVHDGWWISERQFLVDELGRIQTYSADRETNVKLYGERGAARARDLRAALSGAKHILAVSEPFAEIYRNAGFDNVLTVANGLSSLPIAQRTASPDGRVRLGFFGGFEHHKGYPVLRAAFWRGRYPNLSLTIVDHSQGPGEERHDQWGETPVKFVGRRPQHEVGELYGSLDVLLAPSIWPESYGLVTREALSCGLWVVASDRGAVGEYVVEGENGFVIDVETAKGLEDALAAINADPAKYSAPPKRAVNLRKSSDQADELARIYNRVLDTTGEKVHSTSMDSEV